MKEKIKNLLPKPSQQAFLDIVEQRVLGASRHINMIAQMLEELVLINEGADIAIKSQELLNYFISTRGEASAAVKNALLIMGKDIDKAIHLSTKEARELIISNKNSYILKAKEDNQKAISYAVNLCQDLQNIFVYDYSSMVEALILKLKNKHILVAESRAINGGEPFLSACKEAGHELSYFPDCAIMYHIQHSDAAFMGAESFFADGRAFNTIGSDLVALACKHFSVPLYFLSSFIKIDSRPIFGHKKELPLIDLKTKFALSNDFSKINYKFPELVAIEPEFIKAFISERGIIPASAMYEPSISYLQNLS